MILFHIVSDRDAVVRIGDCNALARREGVAVLIYNSVSVDLRVIVCRLRCEGDEVITVCPVL